MCLMLPELKIYKIYFIDYVVYVFYTFSFWALSLY